MDLIPEQELSLPTTANDPIGEIIRASTVMREMSLPVRTRLIAELIAKIEELDNQGEATFSRNMMLGIGSSFSMAAAIATSSAFPPIAGICLSVGALASWGGAMYEVFQENLKIEPIREVLRRLILCLKSAPTDKWAAIWAVAGDDIFVHALKEASKGSVVRNQLIQVGDDRPIDRAIDCVAAFKGGTYELIAAEARAVLSGKVVPQPTVLQRPTFDSIESAAVAIGANLTEGMSRVKEEARLAQEPPIVPVTRMQPPVLPTIDVVDKQTQDIVNVILGSVNSLAFIGGQRCGKSLLMAIASRIGMQEGKFKGVFVVSSLAKAGEDDHYWQHCATKTFYDLAVIIDKTAYYDEFIETIRTFKRTANAANPQLLIIDEFPYLCERLEDDIKEKNEVAIELMKEIAEVGSAVASGGAKRGWYVWLGSPQGNIGEMGRGGKAMKKLSLVFCAIAPGTTVDSNGVAVTWDDNLWVSTSRNFPALQKPARGVAHDLSERIVWMNSKWYAKSQFSLDSIALPQNQSHTIASIEAEDSLSSSERKALRTAVATAKRSQSEILIELLEESQAPSLEDFVRNDLQEQRRIQEVKPKIIELLKRHERFDLLKRFNAN